MKKKIVYIISDIQRSVAFEWIADYIDKNRFDISFLILNPGDSNIEEFLRSNRYQVEHIKCAGKKDWPGAFFSIYSYLRKTKPDAVHCHLQQATILGLAAAKLAGVKKRIYTRHHSSLHHIYFPKGIVWDKYSNKLATHIVAISGIVKTILTDWEQAPESKIRLIPHGFILEEFSKIVPEKVEAVESKYELRGNGPVIGVISRFTEWKGVQYIIPAFKQLVENYPRATLLLFNASGDYEQVLDGMLAELPEHSYRKVKFEPEIMSTYHLMDVFVHTPIDEHSEAFGQIYVEALAAGVPSIFTLSGIAPDFIVDGENALVVPHQSSDAIYKAMHRLLTDPELQKKLFTNGKKSVEAFALGNMLGQLTSLYNE
ncbi:MAG: glycosyltransferase family 1 protein [Sphingobacteriales bacterium]|nr:MAG: glycosyltransferase family 1 protein [Sphingobacteriales bacterium]